MRGTEPEHTLSVKAWRKLLKNTKLTNAFVCLIAAIVFSFVLGFTIGNVLGLGKSFEFEKWQSLAGTLVAIVAVTVAFIGVRGTQRINVVLKEQERLDKLLPGLRQADDFLTRLAGYLNQITARTRYMSIVVIRDYLQFTNGETYEAMVHRRVPLADDDTRREVTGLIVSLIQQAIFLQVADDEHKRALKDLAEIDQFAESAKPRVRELPEMLETSLKASDAFMAAEIESFKQASKALADKLVEATSRREAISAELSRYFDQM